MLCILLQTVSNLTLFSLADRSSAVFEPPVAFGELCGWLHCSNRFGIGVQEST
jgi:hypothetical protein